MIENKNGRGIIKIKSTGIGSYLCIEKPVSLVWYDCQGSIGKYFCLLPYDKDYREKIHQNLRRSINLDYTDQHEKLISDFKPLLELFEIGDFYLNYYNSGFGSNWSVAYNNVLYNSNPISFNNLKRCDHLVQSISNSYTTESFYDGNTDYLVFTEPLEEIDKKCVDKYKDEINKGGRPLAIVFQQHFEKNEKNIDGSISSKSFNSANFIIDGHHKLIAYQDLEVNPPLLIFTRVLKSEAELSFDVEELRDYLFTFQLDHIIKNKNK